MVGEGNFQLFPSYNPTLKAGLYRFTSTHQVSASNLNHDALDADQTPNVQPLQTHVRVRSPQYALPADQVLSTFPPANHEGDFGARLPQIVIKRRTLPWERVVDGDHEEDAYPWLALVLIAEGEAEVRLNQPVADCVTPGTAVDTPADVEVGNYLAIRASAVQRIFPTHAEVPLLAHAREVNIDDTELMMGDDDGFLAVVISNRLPLPGKDADGNDVPVKYLACLVNLCGQLPALLKSEPVTTRFTIPPYLIENAAINLGDADKLSMGTTKGGPTVGPVLQSTFKSVDEPGTKSVQDTATTRIANTHLATGTSAPYVGAQSWAGERGPQQDVYEQMAASFRYADTAGFVVGNEVVKFDRELRFPVLLHWSFTSTGEDTFESLMGELSSGLLGTAEEDAGPSGRPPFEVTETGHVGLDHTLRVGDTVRSWYRGPFVPYPTEDPPEGRLPIAHSSDQLRTVVPDGREDLSLAAAFEIGRLLGLSRPSIVASLLQWRQAGFTAAWLSSSFAARGYLEALDGVGLSADRFVGGHLAALVSMAIVQGPGDILGNPSPLVSPGRPVMDASVAQTLASGLGIDLQTLVGAPATVASRLQQTQPSLPDVSVLDPPNIRDALTGVLDGAFTRVAVEALAPDLRAGTVTIDAAELPVDVRASLESALVPDISALRDRLDLRLGRVSVPKGSDQLDLLMHAEQSPDDGSER